MQSTYYIYQNNELLSQPAQATAQSIYALNKNCSLIEVIGQNVFLFDRKYDEPVVCQDVQEAIYLSALTKD